jgi:hypothetical protein
MIRSLRFFYDCSDLDVDARIVAAVFTGVGNKVHAKGLRIKI